jgi:hypothetical protein
MLNRILLGFAIFFQGFSLSAQQDLVAGLPDTDRQYFADLLYGERKNEQKGFPGLDLSLDMELLRLLENHRRSLQSSKGKPVEMPVYSPEGIYQMPVYIPDSIYFYTLNIYKH